MTEPILTNSLTQAVTRNHFDGGKKYYYRIRKDGRLDYKIGSGDDWQTFDRKVNPYFKETHPNSKINNIKNVAADNNRVFILTTDNQLYWRCFLEDSASWVLFIFKAAELIAEADFDDLIWSLFPEDVKKIEGTDYYESGLKEWASAYRTWVEQTHIPKEGWNPLVKRTWKKNDGEIEYDEFINKYLFSMGAEFEYDLNQTHWELIVKPIFKTEGFPLSENATIRKEKDDKWVITDGKKIYIVKKEDAKLNIYINDNDIIDIAVGNWNNTVVTYYVLVAKPDESGNYTYKIMFLDEEAIMPSWEDVPEQNMITLDKNSRICASHSVVAVTNGNKIHWIRYDAHTNLHIPFWPLNWTEAWVGLPPQIPYDQLLEYFLNEEPPYDIDAFMGPLKDFKNQFLYPPLDVLDKANYPRWHTAVEAQTESICEFHIDVSLIDGEPWPVPKPFVDWSKGPIGAALSFLSPAWQLYFRFALISAAIDVLRGKQHGDVGFLGENPIKPNCNYPVCCVIKSGDNYKGFFIPTSTDVNSIEWKDINKSGSSGIWEKFKEGMAAICNRANNLENGCEEWKEGVCKNVSRWVDGVCKNVSRWVDGVCRDVGGYECCDWKPCSWFCKALVWVANIVCEAGKWVTDKVCEAGKWVTDKVCEAGKWVINSLCKAITMGIKKMTCWARSCWER